MRNPHMTPDRWQHIQDLFEAALERSPAEREAFLRAACVDDLALYDEVKSLLEADSHTHDLLRGLAVEAIDLTPAQIPAGTRVGAYRVLRPIGAGGMGAVYLAQRADGQFEQTVALKVIKLGMDSEQILKRFRSERQILARLRHANIARLLDGGLTDEGAPYFTMEYVEGQPIDVYCDRHKLVIEERLRLFQTVCDAVHDAHRNLVVHRDLKPSNILVTSDGTVKLLDFGVAKVLSEDRESMHALTLTQIGQRVMTPEYASPEQIRGVPVTTASDVYSLGVVLYEILSGHRPYEIAKRSPAEVEKVISTAEPKKPSTAILHWPASQNAAAASATPEGISLARSSQPKRLQRRLAGDLDNICLRALRKEPERRYASVAQLRDDIDRHLSGMPVMARPATLRYRMDKFVRRHTAGVAAAVSMLILIASLVGFYTARLAQERDRAQLEARKAEQVADFLAELFKISDPNEARGRTITARELLDRGAERLETELADQPEVQATMMEVVGSVYQSLAMLDPAAALLEKSLATRRGFFGEEHADLARTLWVLGKVRAEQGNYNAADSLQSLSLSMRRSVFGDQHEEIAQSLGSLGKVKYQKGDYVAADSLHREALAMRRALFGENHAGVALNLDDLGWLMYERGKYDSAETLHRQALAIRQKLFGDEHLEVAESLANLGGALYAQGRYDAAEPFMREALKIRRKLLGEDHPLTTHNLTNLAVLFEARLAYAEAENLYRDILQRHKQKLGEQHPAIADDLTDIGRVLTAQGDFESAEPLYRQALALHRKLRGEEHWLVAYTLNSLGTLLHEKGDPNAAIPVYEQALAIYRQAWKQPNQHVANTLISYGAALTELEKSQSAEPFIREGLEIFQSSLPPDHWQLARAKSILGACLTGRREFTAAESLLVGSYATLKSARGENDKHTRYAQQWLRRLGREMVKHQR